MPHGMFPGITLIACKVRTSMGYMCFFRVCCPQAHSITLLMQYLVNTKSPDSVTLTGILMQRKEHAGGLSGTVMVTRFRH